MIKFERPLTRTIFTDKELEVIYLICEDKTHKQIADELFMSPRTVDQYKERLKQKTDSRSSVGIAMYAIKKGIIKLK